MAAGRGDYPFKSAYAFRRKARGYTSSTQFLTPTLRYGDTDTTEKTVWLEWWFEATGGGSNQTVTPTNASLTLTTFAPTVTINTILTPSVAVLALTALTPTVTLNTILTPTQGSLTLTPFAPTLTTDTIVTPSAASLLLSAFAPTVTATTNATVTPGVASLVLSAFAPTVTNNVNVTPGVAVITITTFSPIVSASGGGGATPLTPIIMSDGTMEFKGSRGSITMTRNSRVAVKVGKKLYIEL